MVKIKTPRYLIGLCIGLVILASLGCSLTQRAAEQAQALPTTAAELLETLSVPTTEEPETEQTSAALPTQTEVAGAGVSIRSLADGLQTLESYRVFFELRYQGSDGDKKSLSGVQTLTEEHIAASESHHLAYRSSGENLSGGEQQAAFEYYRMDKVTYLYNPASDNSSPSCTAFPLGAPEISSFSFLKAEELLGGLDTAQLMETDVPMNGVQTDHYRYDVRKIVLGGVREGEGEFWLARQGGYVVRMIGEAQIQTNLLGRSFEGSLAWDYQVQDINAVTAIPLPPDCVEQQQTGDLPIPPGAEDKVMMGGMITFSIAQPAAEVADFYRTQMPAQGWKAVKDEVVLSLYTLTFHKENRTVQIIITGAESKTTVMMVVMEE